MGGLELTCMYIVPLIELPSTHFHVFHVEGNPPSLMYHSILGHGCRTIHTIPRSTAFLLLSQSRPLQITNHVDALVSLRKIEWGAKVAQYPPTITYMEAMNQDDRGLFKWLTNIVRWFDQFLRIMSRWICA